MRYYFIALIVIALDQASKYLIVKNMELGESIEVIGNFLHITSHRNTGAAWGILEGQMWLFYLITVIVVAVLVYYMQKMSRMHILVGTSLGLMLGGAIGNFIDRVFHKEVVDFVDTNIFGYDFPVFNVADSALTVGVILLMIFMLFEERFMKEKKNG
ncbi:signal peptidase II [Bacillus testis]|uniref:signal peptidase II n=1 Tax=Bacillus testis TaxID=1622072 RepID=UPI00067F3374|nr:signal peptidase II [Bacillus testis]